MNAISRAIEFFWDSPTYGRDRAFLLTGFRIGAAALLLNAVVLMLLLPLLLNPDDPVFQRLTDNVGFGQLLALILLGGATAIATLLIPLRLATVFLEPRFSRYFDQIVISGISPLRFVIGKATSQNLFLGLVLFLLLPYLVLSMTLGGIDFWFFAAGVFVVWLYCMSLALATLWVSLYLNELIAVLIVIVIATTMSILGCIPMQFQPFVLSPFPVLLHPVYTSIPQAKEIVDPSFWPAFISCTASMSVFIAVSMGGIFLGPLYGIIRENSTFGEVVRAGDSKRKRWFRFRPHIQRSSEIAFFYRNRNDLFCRHEGLIRWGIGFGGLLLLMLASEFILHVIVTRNVGIWTQAPPGFIAMEYLSMVLTIHGVGVTLAVILFSHTKNTTYLQLPFVFGRKVEVSKLDTIAFLLFLVISTGAAVAAPLGLEVYFARPNGLTFFYLQTFGRMGNGQLIDFRRIIFEGAIDISVIGLVIYALQRLACLAMWLRSGAIVLVGALYGVLICLLPIFFAVVMLEYLDPTRSSMLLQTMAPTMAVISPFATFVILSEGGMGNPFPANMTTIPFYIFHFGVLLATLFLIRRNGRNLRTMYLIKPASETERV